MTKLGQFMELLHRDVYYLCYCNVVEQKKRELLYTLIYTCLFLFNHEIYPDTFQSPFFPDPLFSLSSSAGTSGKCNEDRVRRNISIHAASVRFLIES